MTFRYARHTNDLIIIEQFYTEIVGLKKLGSFENHDDYDGIFLGHDQSNWHLEFTTSPDIPQSKFDEDDALVFYLSSEIALKHIKQKLNLHRIKIENPKNPYWAKNGMMISDPDGYKIIFSIRHYMLTSDDDLTKLVLSEGINNWSELLSFTRDLPYGRNANREDFSLVIKEKKGTCSSKHSFIKKLAELNAIDDVILIIGMYRMTGNNTPKIGDIILNNGLDYIPEAHCYLMINGQRLDITNPDSDINTLMDDIIEEVEITPEQVNEFKVDYHKRYLNQWIDDNNIDLDFDTLWTIREACIGRLSDS